MYHDVLSRSITFFIVYGLKIPLSKTNYLDIIWLLNKKRSSFFFLLGCTHCSWSKFEVKKNSHKNQKRSNVENEYTNILMYHMKRSVGKFLRYWIFLILVCHTLYFAHVLWHIWSTNEINTSKLTKMAFVIR